MATKEATGWRRRIVPGGSRAPLVITVVVLAAIAGAYYAYYRNQVAYFTGRNLRLLSTLTAQIDDRVNTFAGFVRTRATIRDKTPIDVEKCSAESAGSTTTTASSAAHPDADEVKRSIEETSSGWLLRLAYTSVSTAANTAAGSVDSAAGTVQPGRWCAGVPLDKVIRPIFTRKVGAAFDILLVARADGTVLYSVRPPSSSSTLLRRDDEDADADSGAEDDERPPDNTSTTGTPSPVTMSGTSATASARASTPSPATTTASPKKRRANVPSSSLKALAARPSGATFLMTNLGSLSKRTGWRSNPEKLDTAALSGGTYHTEVSLDGSNYILFTQPYTFARVPVSGTSDGKAQQWIVGGLVSASRFRYDVTAVSTSLMLAAVALALLAICCWPFLRIAFIDQSQPLTITDVILIVLCTIVGAAVITMALLDVIAYASISRDADRQLGRFANGVNDDFAENLARATKVLARVEGLTSGLAGNLMAQSSRRGLQPIPESVVNDAEVGRYPYIDSIAWIDKEGLQRVKFAQSDGNSRVAVNNRRYFSDALHETTWPVNVKGGGEYVLEWVRSMATGEVRAVVAKKTARADLPVIAMATDLIDVAHAVRPPGVELAIIDEDGEVVYHSDSQRIGYENFFAEADQSRELRSAVVARRAGPVGASYWGEGQGMYVRPLDGSPWTLVTFRAKRLTRVMNVEGVLLTLLMLLLNAMPYLVLYLIVLAVAPWYRAPSLWPDADRWGDYLRLNILLAALLGVFCLGLYALMPWSSFFVVLTIPALAILTTYLVLHRAKPRRFAVAAALCAIGLAFLIFLVIMGDVDSALFFSGHPIVVKSLLVVAILAALGLAIALLRTPIPNWPGAAKLAGALRSRVGYGTLYRLCGVLLLAIGAAMPVVGFFTISRRAETEALVKYGQLRAAADLEHRIDQLLSLSILPHTSPAVYGDILARRFADVFHSHWALTPPLGAVDSEAQRELEGSLCLHRRADNWTIPSTAARWMPALYEDSVAIRSLYDAGSTDDLWHWCLDGRIVKLVRTIRLDPDVARRVWPTGTPPRQKIAISSRLPQVSLWSSSPGPDGKEAVHDAATASWCYFGAFALAALPLLILFWYAADFIANRVLLIDVAEPIWLARLPLSPTLGDHIFLVRRDRKAEELTGPDPMGKGLPFIDVVLGELDRSDDWAGVLERLDSSEAGRNVRIVDFEYGINDGAVNEKKLQWLERLLSLPDRTVIIVSAVSAAYVMTTPPPPVPLRAAVLWYYERWRDLLDRFVWITADDLELRHDEWQRRMAGAGKSAEPAASRAAGAEENARGASSTWLDRETAHNSFLHRLRRELDPHSDRKRLIDEIGERAETYYAGLWASCRGDEKLLLYQIAHNGLANGKNRRMLRRLIARGLVRRDPNLELFSETFRLHVLGAARREDLVSRARAERPASTWDSLRLPFFVIIVSFLVLLFATQKDLLTTTTALAAALTTGLPMMVKLLGVFTERRLDTSDSG